MSAQVGLTRSTAVPHRRRRWRPQQVAREGLRYLVVAVVLLFVLFPIVWLITMAFKDAADYYNPPPVWFPRHPTFSHFVTLASFGGYHALFNSLVVSTCSTVLSLAIGCMGAYSIARYRTGGSNLSFWFVSQRMLPPIAVVLPLFLLMRIIGWIDTYQGLIVIYVAFNTPYVVWMMRGYFLEIPIEIEDSGLVDGCGRLGILWHIVLPLARAGLISTGIFVYIFCWSDFLIALIMTKRNAITATVALTTLQGGTSFLWGEVAALALLSAVPLFILGPLVQRHFVRGVTLAEVK